MAYTRAKTRQVVGKAAYLSLQEVVTDPHMTAKDELSELNAG